MITDKELIDRIVALFNEVELTDEEMEQVLRDNGIDPEEYGKHFAEMVQDAIDCANQDESKS